MNEIINTDKPYCCTECGAALGDFHMQHFPRRTLVEGACETLSCSKRHSHQTAQVVWAGPARYETLKMINARRGIPIGEFFYDASDRKAVQS